MPQREEILSFVAWVWIRTVRSGSQRSSGANTESDFTRTASPRLKSLKRNAASSKSNSALPKYGGCEGFNLEASARRKQLSHLSICVSGMKGSRLHSRDIRSDKLRSSELHDGHPHSPSNNRLMCDSPKGRSRLLEEQGGLPSVVN